MKNVHTWPVADTVESLTLNKKKKIFKIFSLFHYLRMNMEYGLWLLEFPANFYIWILGTLDRNIIKFYNINYFSLA